MITKKLKTGIIVIQEKNKDGVVTITTTRKLNNEDKKIKKPLALIFLALTGIIMSTILQILIYYYL
jgi:hypothetical protein